MFRRAANQIQDQDGASLGRRTVNTEPLPSSLVTVTSPPIMRASLAGDGKAEPGAAVSARGQGICLREFLEQFRLLLHRHADAAVGDRKLDPVCTENLIRIDCVTESPNVNGDDRALLPRPDPCPSRRSSRRADLRPRTRRSVIN